MTGSSIPDASKSQDSPHKYDIEHVPVENDPRKWTPFRKVRCLLDLHTLSAMPIIRLSEFYVGVDILSGYDRRIRNKYSKSSVTCYQLRQLNCDQNSCISLLVYLCSCCARDAR